MSDRLKVPDVLDRKQGGSAPLFHAQLQLTWARLGRDYQLVADTDDPLEQIEKDKGAIPKVQPYLVYQGNALEEQPMTGDKVDVSSELLIASWVHRIKKNDTLTHERRFLLRQVKREAPSSKRDSPALPKTTLTDYLVGSHSTQKTRIVELGDFMVDFEMSSGVTDEEADELVGYMDGPSHRSRIEARIKLLKDSHSRAIATVDSFPSWADLKGEDSKVDILGNVSYGGVAVDGLVQRALNAQKVQEQLTKTPPTSLLHDKLMVAGNVTGLMRL